MVYINYRNNNSSIYYSIVTVIRKVIKITIEKKGIKLAGKLKVWQSRLASYIGVMNFLMIFYLYIIESPLDYKWYYWGLIVILCITILMFIDIRYIFPASQEYSFNKHPEMTKLKEKIKSNSDKLDEILERIK